MTDEELLRELVYTTRRLTEIVEETTRRDERRTEALHEKVDEVAGTLIGLATTLESVHAITDATRLLIVERLTRLRAHPHRANGGGHAGEAVVRVDSDGQIEAHLPRRSWRGLAKLIAAAGGVATSIYLVVRAIVKAVSGAE